MEATAEVVSETAVCKNQRGYPRGDSEGFFYAKSIRDAYVDGLFKELSAADAKYDDDLESEFNRIGRPRPDEFYRPDIDADELLEIRIADGKPSEISRLQTMYVLDVFKLAYIQRVDALNAKINLVNDLKNIPDPQ
ncbi:MAG: hypothetical protein M1469_01280 [Bacteroidetes bacterium]|nr:hypothetical protein [Bacteroidota bacterium]